MNGWSTSPPASFAGQPDLFSALPERRPVVRCWLAFDRDGRDNDVAHTLASHRHLIVDARTGVGVVGDDDLVLMPDRGRDQFICLGPSWLTEMLPQRFRSKGPAFWSPGGAAVPMFRPVPVPNDCLAFDARPGPPTDWSKIRAHAARFLWAADDDPADDKFGPVDGLLCFELARQVARDGGRSEAKLERAKALFRRAMRKLAVDGLHAWAEAAERHASTLGDALFLLRQAEIPGLLSSEDAADFRLSRLGVGVQSLLAMPLPPLPLTGDVRSSWAPTVAGRRSMLCTVPLRQQALRRLLPPPEFDDLRGRVILEPWADGRRIPQDAPPARLRLGASLKAFATLDGEIHHLLRVASRGHDPEGTFIFADGNGVTVSPSYRHGRIGYPATFKLTARERGRHAVRFTFLTRDRVVSKVYKTVEVIGERGKDGRVEEGSQG